MAKNKIHYYSSDLKSLTREYRIRNPLSEVLLWNNIKDKALGVEFYRKIPIDECIVDFYCHELRLVIDVFGGVNSNDFFNYERCEEKFKKLGVKIIRIDDRDIKKFMDEVILSLEMIICQRRAELKII
jgi:very-short-patch-repair endonuclease